LLNVFVSDFWAWPCTTTLGFELRSSNWVREMFTNNSFIVSYRKKINQPNKHKIVIILVLQINFFSFVSNISFQLSTSLCCLLIPVWKSFRDLIVFTDKEKHIFAGLLILTAVCSLDLSYLLLIRWLAVGWMLSDSST
jgi:hypothetical protein